MNQAEMLRQQARQQRKMDNLKRAAEIVRENGMTRLQALTVAVLDAHEKQNSIYSDSGRNV
jgi:hypothetical protein